MAKGKTKKSRKETKKIEQYCSVCKETFSMEVVDDTDSEEVLWLRCPGCQGFLPHMTGVEGEIHEEEGDDAEVEDFELAPEDLTNEEKDNAKIYSQSELYKIDDIIYHRSWNDYGKVIEKDTLPGDRKVIIVQFVEQGRTRLLEGVE